MYEIADFKLEILSLACKKTMPCERTFGGMST